MTASVCLCTYNGGRYLRPLLKSLAAEHLLPAELLVGDDGSSDETLAILEEFAATAPFPVEILANERRLGPFANLERLLSRATGDLVFPCDQDDIWAPEKIEVLASALDASPRQGAAICDSSLIDASGALLPGSLFAQVGLDDEVRRHLESGSAIVQIAARNVVASHALALRRSALELVLPFGPPGHGDWWIALVLGATTGITVVEDRLVAYRLHETNTVGLTEAPQLADRVSATAAARFSHRAELLSAALARIDALRPGTLTSSERADVESRVAHLVSRATLAPRRSQRVLPVLRETASGRYGRYGNGWRSALIDLVGNRAS